MTEGSGSMDLQLTGKLALITGASKGIGYAVATLLAEEGCDLVLVSRDAGRLARAAEDIRGRRQVAVRIMPADLSRQDEVERIAGEIPELDILVNNAGAIPPGDLEAVDNGKWRAAWDLKVFGYVGLSRALYPALKRRQGVIVNVIGSAGERFDPGYIAGTAGNAALMAFTRALGKSAQADGMRVVGINPGPVATERLQTMFRARAATELGDPGRWRELTRSMPYGRPAAPDEIASAVAFLASLRSGYTNGTILTIDGGPR
jgi:NAD(P)-dependent dehydrogenase (short-subunit alcohol dehydrogenase family)